MKCTILFLAIFGLLAFSARGQVNGTAAGPRPNVVFILADDLGYGDVHCFNPEGKIPTPHVDQLAAAGMKFTDAHASSAVCTPSRYSVLTGRYPWRSRLQKGVLYGFSRPLIAPGRMTVATLFRQAGYYTACIGKWHLGMDWPLKKDSGDVKTGWEVDYAKPVGNGPITRGFDYFYGISASLDMPPFAFIENDHTVGIPAVTKKWVREGPAVADFDAADVVPSVTAKAVGLMASRTEAHQPFFLYLALPSPHTPIVPDGQFQGKSGVTAYGDYVMETDWAVGQVMHALDSLGIADNTLVVFSSDNGFAPYVLKTYNTEALGHYPSYIFRGYKSDIWEGGHRVPTVIRWPGHVKAGSVSDHLISLTDFMATAAELLGKELPDNVAEDSYSFLPVLLGGSGKPRPAVVYQSIDGSFSIQEGRWKLEFCPGSGGWEAPTNAQGYRQGLPEVQLYDMGSDVRETTNVEAGHPDVVQRLTELMKQYVRTGRSMPGRPEDNDVPVKLFKQSPSQKKAPASSRSPR